MFNSLLVYAGLATSGGYEQELDPEFVALIQNVVGRCLEKVA
jgi:myosin-7